MSQFSGAQTSKAHSESSAAQKNSSDVLQRQSFSAPVLQRAIGNSRLQKPCIQRACKCGGTCSSCASKSREESLIQTKLTVGAANDVYEKEADRVATQVMRMSADTATEASEASVATHIQRLGAGAEGGFDPGPNFKAQQGGGQPLSQSTRGFMESRFGADFSSVRVHSGPQAERSASEINARAYTYGNHITLGKGESAGNRKLMAHELTHVIQQGGGGDRPRLQRQAAAPAPRFANCTANQSARMEVARRRARNYVSVAMSKLRAAPVAGTTYETAAARHFISPTAAQRTALRATYGQISAELARRNNFLCDPTHATCNGGVTQAFWAPADDLVHICNRFWDFNPTCRAIILIHEVAHDNGVDAAPGPHTANRGDATYPAGNTAPPGGQTTAGRMNTPDAYAFFAAHVWRSTDTSSTCF